MMYFRKTRCTKPWSPYGRAIHPHGVPPRERMEGKLKVVTRTYDTPDGRVTAEFAEGVLFRFTVTSQ